MLKVFLAEDEYVIRRGIKNNIDWTANGYEFCGEAGDGELAFSLVKELKPDILITDIRMPFMDGLELSRRVKEELPDTEIIILSGYEEFEYAKESIRIGVAQYLTKPISGDALLKELEGIKTRIISKRENEAASSGGNEFKDIFNKFSELSSSFEEVSKKYLESKSAEDIDLERMNIKQISKEKVRGFLRTGSMADAERVVSDFFEELGEGALKSLLFRQYIIMDIYFYVADFAEGLGFDRNQVETFDPASGIMQSAEKTREYVTRLLKSAVELREQTSGNKYKEVLDAAVSYIEEHYSDDELSLNLLASYVNVSPNHLSMIFSEHLGQTFIKYLTDCRMEHAKELIRCTGKKTGEIALSVGYKDPHYFSYLFKKTQGCTPTEYREGKSTEEA